MEVGSLGMGRLRRAHLLVAAASSFTPFYPTTLRVSRALYLLAPSSFKKFKERTANQQLPFSPFPFRTVLIHTIRRMLLDSSLDKKGRIAYIEHDGTCCYNPIIYVSMDWVEELKKLTPLAFSVIAHELFHFFFHIYLRRYAIDVPYEEEELALAYERHFLSLNFPSFRAEMLEGLSLSRL